MLVIFTVVPFGEGESISPLVAKIIEEVDKSGLSYKLTSMGTIIEGEWDGVMAVVKKCHKLMLKHSRRVVTTMTIDDRKGARNRLSGKVESVLAKTKRKIST